MARGGQTEDTTTRVAREVKLKRHATGIARGSQTKDIATAVAREVKPKTLPRGLPVRSNLQDG